MSHWWWQKGHLAKIVPVLQQVLPILVGMSELLNKESLLLNLDVCINIDTLVLISNISYVYFIQREGFCLVHTPILTANDCEGAGEVFAIEVNLSDLIQ